MTFYDLNIVEMLDFQFQIKNRLDRFTEAWLPLSSSSPEGVMVKSLETKARLQNMHVETSLCKTGGVSRHLANLNEGELMTKSKDGWPGMVWKRNFSSWISRV